VKVTFTDANGKTQVKEAEKVLVAVGRAGRPATSAWRRRASSSNAG
jgi:pyruvate/2-oxoglutarate dehydrogenase complex dihydrolipoamide dehydrogenase (E3) component